MKLRNSIVMPLLAIIVGLSMVVSAGLIVSNVVERHNHVLPTEVVWLEMRDTVLPEAIGPDLTNYSEEDGYMGTPMDFNLYVKANASVSAVSIIVQFEKSTLNASDVSMSWSDSDGPWNVITWVVVSGVMTGHIGPTSGYGADNDANYYLTLSFNVPGDYTMMIWAEGTL